MMRVVACMPVYGRRRLLSRTITRLYEKNKVFKVICAGDDVRDRAIAEKFGAEWVYAPNQPLGHKWNEAFFAAKKYDPDACVFIGSSDWLEDKWMDYMEQFIEDYDLIGTPDHYMCDYRQGKIRVAYWELYPGSSKRSGEAVGGGRILTKRLLDIMEWRPFDATWDHSMDYSMTQHAIRVGARQLLLDGNTLMVLAMSSDKWRNKHNLDRELLAGRAVEWDRGRGIEYLAEHFPEALSLFDDNKWDFLRQDQIAT
jgi:glycosyltransferase involved in cell wall biosynthesis